MSTFLHFMQLAYLTAVVTPGADPGFIEGGFGKTSACIIQLLLLFHKKYSSGQNISVCFTAGGSARRTTRTTPGSAPGLEQFRLSLNFVKILLNSVCRLSVHAEALIYLFQNQIVQNF